MTEARDETAELLETLQGQVMGFREENYRLKVEAHKHRTEIADLKARLQASIVKRIGDKRGLARVLDMITSHWWRWEAK